ncbi:hypothetical protein KQH82_01015 [bacterium]|nr:hypothetical protein [bacterium]
MMISLQTSARLLAASAVLFVLACAGCGGGDDDDDKKGDNRPVIEIHMSEEVRTSKALPNSVSADAKTIGLVNPGGPYYTVVMGTDSLNKEMAVVYSDSTDTHVDGGYVRFEIVEGDGHLSADSNITDSEGRTTISYTMDGALPYAVIRAISDADDTLPVNMQIRGNVLRYGVDGQGQHIRFTDSLHSVLGFNGTPESIDRDPRNGVYLHYVVYETDQQVVTIMADTNQNLIADQYEGVVGIILTAGYPERFPEGIGLGSTYDQMVAAYGAPDSVGFDGTAPAADIYFYWAEGLTFFVEAATSKAANSLLGPGGADAADRPARGYRAFHTR